MKKWIFYNLTTLFFILTLIGTFNWYVDPMWAFNHKQPFLELKGEFNEREQKTNLVNFRKFDYDGIILGSSKISIINQNNIKNYRVFNYAANAMNIYEFNNYIEFAKKKNKKPFKVIVLGLDFDSIQENAIGEKFNFTNVLSTIQDPFYRQKLLFSADTFIFSKNNIDFNIRESYSQHFKMYDKNYIAYTIKHNPKNVETEIKNATYNNQKIIYDRTKYLNCLNEIKRNNPNTKFVIMITPLNEVYFKTLMMNNQTEEIYKLWLNDLVNIFGQINNFAYVNSVTQDYQNTYVDTKHFKSAIGK